MHAGLQRVEEQIESLKQSEYGQKVALVDAAVGRIYGWLIAVVWFVLAAIILWVAGLISSSAAGTFASLISIGSLPLAVYIACLGCGEILSPRNASEIMIDELRARFKPHSWAIDFFNSLRGRTESKTA